jgi:hypothetical protein
MMADARDQDPTGDILIKEVDEDLRREQFLNLWKRYGIYMIAAAVAVVVIVAGWQGWQAYQRDVREKAAQRYAAALELVQAGKPKDAEDALAKIASDGTGFAVLAGMRRAAMLSDNGDLKGAVAAYDQVAASSAPELLRGLATLKEGMLILGAPADAGIDAGPIQGRIGALALVGSPWYYQSSELLALFAQKKGDQAHAIELFKRLSDDAQAPQGIRARASGMLAALGVPPTPPAAPAATPAPAPVPAAAPAPANEGAK